MFFSKKHYLTCVVLAAMATIQIVAGSQQASTDKLYLHGAFRNFSKKYVATKDELEKAKKHCDKYTEELKKRANNKLANDFWKRKGGKARAHDDSYDNLSVTQQERIKTWLISILKVPRTKIIAFGKFIDNYWKNWDAKTWTNNYIKNCDQNTLITDVKIGTGRMLCLSKMGSRLYSFYNENLKNKKDYVKKDMKQLRKALKKFTKELYDRKLDGINDEILKLVKDIIQDEGLLLVDETVEARRRLTSVTSRLLFEASRL